MYCILLYHISVCIIYHFIQYAIYDIQLINIKYNTNIIHLHACVYIYIHIVVYNALNDIEYMWIYVNIYIYIHTYKRLIVYIYTIFIVHCIYIYIHISTYTHIYTWLHLIVHVSTIRHSMYIYIYIRGYVPIFRPALEGLHTGKSLGLRKSLVSSALLGCRYASRTWSRVWQGQKLAGRWGNLDFFCFVYSSESICVFGAFLKASVFTPGFAARKSLWALVACSIAAARRAASGCAQKSSRIWRQITFCKLQDYFRVVFGCWPCSILHGATPVCPVIAALAFAPCWPCWGWCRHPCQLSTFGSSAFAARNLETAQAQTAHVWFRAWTSQNGSYHIYFVPGHRVRRDKLGLHEQG